MSKAAILRYRLERPGITKIVGAHNALGAKLAERAGFDGVWSSGLEISTSYAVPDANILTMSEYLATAAAMANAVNIPIVADCDTGYGNSNNVIHMVHKFEAAGVAAVCIEDKLFPKVNSFVPGRQDLAPIAEFVGKIMAAKNAQCNDDFMVIARVEALIAGLGHDEALKRAHAYVDAGADAILMHNKSASPQPIVDFLQAWDFSAPVVVVPTTYYTISAQELEDLGVKMVIYANHGLRAAISAMEEVFHEIQREGSTGLVEGRIAPMKLVFELQGMPLLKQDEEIYLRTAMPRTRALVPAAGDHLDEYSMKDIASDIPMAMLDVNGKPLLQRQMEVLNLAGVGDVTVVGGYKMKRINVGGTKLLANPEWQETGEMVSILQGANGYKGRTLIAYSDILFDVEPLERLLGSEADITLLIDRTFKGKQYTSERRIDLVKLAQPFSNGHRSLNNGSRHQVLRIGQNVRPEEADCEFVGLALFSAASFSLLCEDYEAVLKRPQTEAFQEALSPRQASLTDILQELIDAGHEVIAIEVSSGWMEIHSFDDYRLACELVAR